VLTAATAAAASCGATLGPATPALAGGVPGRVCPAGARVDIRAGDESPPSPPTHVDPGFYAQTGLYWPPTTAIACRVGAGVGHPLLKLARNGCAAGKLGFLIPDDTASPTGTSPGPTPTWGTFLPAGWYSLAGHPRGGWTEVCWTIASPTSPAGPPSP